MTAPHIVLAHGAFFERLADEEGRNGRATFELSAFDNADVIRTATKDADAIMVTTNPLPATFIQALSDQVRIIGRAGVGIDSIDLEAAARRGIAVFHTPDYCMVEVATHTVAMLLALQRRLVQADTLARRAAWADWRSLGEIPALQESTVGVVGAGRIGRTVMSMLKPVVGSLLAYDPYSSEVPAGVEAISRLEELLPRADIVSLHLPLTPETVGIIGLPQFNMMRRGALLVNVSRGALIDQSALVEVLKSGQLGGAALDVLVEEPPSLTSPILSAPNTLLTPHVAWYSTAAEARCRSQVVEGVLAYLEGKHPETGRLAVQP
ncbi:MAG: C-terminal binding protein [Candidatus Dormibacteraceae bacterium]